MSKFEIYTDKKGETRFRFRAKNGEIVFSSEGYTAKASAKRAIASIKKNVPGAVVEEAVAPAKKVAGKPAASKATAAAKASKPVAKKISKTTPSAKQQTS
jgi:uncharacterized protein YegP (UPF0339 family)